MSESFDFGSGREQGTNATTDLVRSAVLRFPANRAFLEGRRSLPQVRQLHLHRFAALCAAMALVTLYAAVRQGDSGAATFSGGLLMGAATLVVADRLLRNSRTLRGAAPQGARVLDLDRDLDLDGTRQRGEVAFRLLGDHREAPAQHTRWPNHDYPQPGNLLAVVASGDGRLTVL